MIGYITLGTNDLPRAVAYYDKLMEMFGAGRFMEEETFVAWSESMDKPGLSVCKPRGCVPDVQRQCASLPVILNVMTHAANGTNTR